MTIRFIQARIGARRAAARRRPASQRGMGMIELLIVILIAMFMMAGLLTIVYGTRQNFTAQSQLAQLQDSERLAMTLITNVVQTAGYYPNPTTLSRTAALPVLAETDGTNSASFALRQVVSGTGSNAGVDQIWVRYITSGADDVMDCNGQTQTASTTLVNYLYVSGGVLWCEAFWGTTVQTAQPLVAGVSAMNILYGINTAGSATPAADTYMTAAQVTTAGAWAKVVSVQVQLTYSVNAIVSYKGTSGANLFSGWTPTLTRTVDLLNNV
jgi:type IV pilus assembly protein PilW